MKIVIPVENKSMDSDICASFGRAPCFLFYDTITKESYFLDNSAVASQGGAGYRAAQVIADHGVRAVLTPGCGDKAGKALRKYEVLVYKTVPGTIRQNIDQFTADKLVLLDDYHPGFHGNEKVGI